MEKNIEELLKKIESSGELKKALPALFQIPSPNTRRLLSKEIEVLERQGNRSPNWENILVSEEFIPNYIYNNTFYGNCILGRFSGIEIEIDTNMILNSGIYNSTIKNSQIGNEALIQDCGLISNYTVSEKAVLLKNEIIHSTGESTYGNEEKIIIGNETGGREIPSFAELTIELAEIVVKNREKKELLKKYEDFVSAYTEKLKAERGLIASKAVVLANRQIIDVLIGNGAIVRGTTLVKNTTLLSSTEEPVRVTSGACVEASCIQWGSSIETMAIVEHSVLTEHSHVERHGKVTHSILGPNTGIAEGEVTSSLVGPFVGFHHQSLLISAIWPEGKGNVGYGANVGSNHTSKAPDQEIFCGEGTFFGLGVNVKFPTDLSDAPYSIIATGVNTLPQRVEFPFSLINAPAQIFEGISPAYNEILPAWVLSDNIFTVRRNEGKYKKRNKAKRSSFVFEVFRPDTVDKMIRAKERLEHIEKQKDIYLDRDIKGLGKNYLQEKNRIKAIETYHFYTIHYALMGLIDVIEILLGEKSPVSEDTVYNYMPTSKHLSEEPKLDYWKHRKRILSAEGLTKRSLKENLSKLLEMEEQIAQNTEKSKAKDDRRGERIIPDYSYSHTPASKDAFVIETWKELEKLKERINSYGILG